MSVPLPGDHAPRPVRSVGTWACAGWRLRLVEVVHGDGPARPELWDAARQVASETLPGVPQDDATPRLGFLCVHDGAGADFVFLGLWANGNELRHVVWADTDKDPATLRRVGRDEPVACVWDVVVLWQERQAWVETMLRGGGGPEAYLGRAYDLTA